MMKSSQHHLSYDTRSQFGSSEGNNPLVLRRETANAIRKSAEEKQWRGSITHGTVFLVRIFAYGTMPR